MAGLELVGCRFLGCFVVVLLVFAFVVIGVTLLVVHWASS